MKLRIWTIKSYNKQTTTNAQNRNNRSTNTTISPVNGSKYLKSLTGNQCFNCILYEKTTKNWFCFICLYVCLRQDVIQSILELTAILSLLRARTTNMSHHTQLTTCSFLKLYLFVCVCVRAHTCMCLYMWRSDTNFLYHMPQEMNNSIKTASLCTLLSVDWRRVSDINTIAHT